MQGFIVLISEDEAIGQLDITEREYRGIRSKRAKTYWKYHSILTQRLRKLFGLHNHSFSWDYEKFEIMSKENEK